MRFPSCKLIGIVLSGSIAALAGATCAAGPILLTGTIRDTAAPAKSLTIADLDGDGIEDAIVFPAERASVAFLKGCADGGFVDEPVLIDAGDSPVDGTVADLDDDGTPDLVAVARDDASVFVRLGVGDGTLSPGVAWPTPAGPIAVKVGDVNGDGHLDLVTLHRDAGVIAVLRGRGDGALDPPISFPTAANARRFAVADMNGDYRSDVIVPALDEDAVALYLGTPTGMLSPPVMLGVGDGPNDVVAADLNADGKMDLATSDGDDEALSILWGKGDGSFTAGAPVAIGEQPYLLASGDLDQKPGLELVVGGWRKLTVVGRDDRGAFVVVQTAFAGAWDSFYASDIVIHDADQDGVGDLVYAASHRPRLVLRPGHGDGTVDLPVQIDIGSQRELLVGDLDSDGFDDLVGIDTIAEKTDVFLNVADAGFDRVQTFDGGTAAALGDYDGDGRLDLVRGAAKDVIEIRPGNGDGTFGDPAVHDAEGDVAAVVSGDLDRDGRLDVVIASARADTVRVLYGGGNGALEPPVRVAVAEVVSGQDPASVAMGDVNGDGVRDLVVVASGDLAVTLGLGDRAYAPPVAVQMGGLSREVIVTDVNHDGIDDLVSGEVNGLWWRRAIGDGTFAPAQSVSSAGARLFWFTAGDVDRDGDVDVVGADVGGSKPLQVYRNVDGGTFHLTRLEMADDTRTNAIGLFDRGCRASIVAADLIHGPPSLIRARVAPAPAGDVTCNGAVGFDDLTTILNAWGPCPTKRCRADVNEDGTIDVADVGIVLAGWGAGR